MRPAIAHIDLSVPSTSRMGAETAVGQLGALSHGRHKQREAAIKSGTLEGYKTCEDTVELVKLIIGLYVWNPGLVNRTNVA